MSALGLVRGRAKDHDLEAVGVVRDLAVNQRDGLQYKINRDIATGT